MWRNRLTVFATAIAAIGFCFAPAAAATGNAQEFRRVNCSELGFKKADLDAAVECGWLTVPEGKSLRKVRIAVVIARATEPNHAAEPMLYLHGGPGIATLDVVPRALKGKSWPLFRRQHDLIFFDQRGTGRSTPAICAKFNKAVGSLAESGVAGRTKSRLQLAAASECPGELQAFGVDPASYSATAIAADAEMLREALGVDRWNLFATSFGSLPAAELVRRWPTTVRSLILDSAYPPNSANNAEQISASAASFRAFQRRCDAIPECRSEFPNLRGLAARIIARLDQSPIAATKGRITGETFRDALWTLMVDGSTAPYLPALLKHADNDDGLIRRFTEVFGDPGYFGGYAFAQAWLVNCHDIFPRPSRRLIDRAKAQHPDLASGVTSQDQDAMCDTLQPSHVGAGFFQPLRTDVPVLVMFGEFDPATPRDDALTAREFFGAATLVEVDGASHAPFYTDDCTKSIATSFVAAPTAPVDRSCLASRRPFAFADAAAFEKFAADLGK